MNFLFAYNQLNEHGITQYRMALWSLKVITMRLSTVFLTVCCTAFLGMLTTVLIGLDVQRPVFAMQWFLASGVLMLFFVVEDHLLGPKPWDDGWTRARTGSLLLSVGLISLGLRIGLVQTSSITEDETFSFSALWLCAVIYWVLSSLGLLLVWLDSGHEYSRQERRVLYGIGGFVAIHVVYSMVLVLR